MTSRSTKIITTKSPKATVKKLAEIPSSPKRSDTVEGLLERVITEQPVSYEDVFKTRNRVIDDRSTPMNSPAKSKAQLPSEKDERPPKSHKSKILEEVDGFLNSLYQQRGDLSSASKSPNRVDISKYSFSNQKSNRTYNENDVTENQIVDQSRSTSPTKGSVAKRFVAWDVKSEAQETLKTKLLSKELSAFQTESIRNDESDKNIVDDSGDFVEMLKSSSQILILPEIEAKYLKQYHLDSSLFKNISVKVEALSKKMKDITRFIKAKIKEEEAMLTPYIIKIQAWYRGWRCRKYLIAANLPIYNRSRYYPDLQKANIAAIKIQSIWRGVYVRLKSGPDFKISLLKAIVKSQDLELKKMKYNHEKDINDIKRVLQSLISTSTSTSTTAPTNRENIPVDELLTEPLAS